MGINQEDVNEVKSLLWPDEVVELTVRQRRIGPGGSAITPASVVATDKRIMLINRTSLGLRKDYEIIMYRQIASVRLEKGVISSSVFIRVQGYDTTKGLLKQGMEEGEIIGLTRTDAELLANHINEKISYMQTVQSSTTDSKGQFVYCSKCGAKNLTDTKFCSSCGAKIVR